MASTTNIQIESALFRFPSYSFRAESSLDSLCTEFHWGHLNLKSYFLTDSFCLRYDIDIWSNAASSWLVQIPSHESVWPMTRLVTLLFNDHWLFITISSWFSEKSRDQPGPEVKAAKCETDWENYQGITNFITIFTQTVRPGQTGTWRQTGERLIFSTI